MFHLIYNLGIYLWTVTIKQIVKSSVKLKTNERDLDKYFVHLSLLDLICLFLGMESERQAIIDLIWAGRLSKEIAIAFNMNRNTV